MSDFAGLSIVLPKYAWCHLVPISEVICSWLKLHQHQARQSTAKSPIYNCLQNENVSC